MKKQKDPRFNMLSLGNIVAKMFNVPVSEVWKAADTKPEHQKIGAYLVSQGSITPEQLRRALNYQEAHRTPFKDLPGKQRESARELIDTLRGGVKLHG